MDWTPNQKKVIDTRNRNILVSAAAGSGKTAVLVERIIKKITDKENPIDIDKLLVLTFTRAAASEMSERVRIALDKISMDNPNDKNIKKQLSLIHNANITTIDSFCSRVVKENFDKVDIDPNYRMADSSELKLLKEDVLKDLINDYYESKDEKFMDLIKKYAKGKITDNVSKLILTIDEKASNSVDPVNWLNNTKKIYNVETKEDLENSSWIIDIVNDLKDKAEYYADSLEMICQEIDAALKDNKSEKIYNVVIELRKIKDCNTLEELINKWPEFNGNKASFPSSLKPDSLKAVLSTKKTQIFKCGKNDKSKYLSRSVDEILTEMKLCKSQIDTLIDLTLEYRKAYEKARSEKNIMDFCDVSMAALEILNDRDEEGNYIPSKTAKAMSTNFEEIMIDEYQDSNMLQELILSSLAGGFGYNNMFMVGDVKQSIYRFRNANPELFIDKFDNYSSDLTDDSVKIVLDDNFRSRQEVINSVNFIFDFIMHREVGGIQYTENNRLNKKADYPKLPENQDNSTEIIMVEKTTGCNNGASFVASKIKEMVDSKMMVADKGVMRPIKYSDIVILLRNIKTPGPTFKNELDAQGVPVFLDTQNGFFDSLEVSIMVDILSIINNPHQDIALAAVMTNDVFGFTPNELAKIKTKGFGGDLYSVINQYANALDDDLAIKTRNFIELIDYYRSIVSHTSVYDLINDILNRTGLEYYVRSLPNGDSRILNLDILKRKANEYDAISYKGLFNFIRYIEKISSKDTDIDKASTITESDNVVRIMTIHSSKGLQFPVVIFANANTSLTGGGNKVPIEFDDKGDVSIECIDEVNMFSKKTMLDDYIKEYNDREEKAEDLRLLYVALTRAQEKLIITGEVKDETVFASYRLNNDKFLNKYDLLASKNYFDLIGKACAMNKSYNDIDDELDDELRQRLMSIERYGIDSNIAFKYVSAESVEHRKNTNMITDTVTKTSWLKDLESKEVDKNAVDKMLVDLDFEYPYVKDIALKSKVSVTELKKEHLEDIEYMHESVAPQKEYRELDFTKKTDDEVTGSMRGTAYHKIFELLDFKKSYNEEEISTFIKELADDNLIDKKVVSSINPKDILSFTDTELFKRMSIADENNKLYKEQKFLLGVNANEINDTDSDELVVIQGIIDAMFIEDNKVVIVDYKTDSVSDFSELKDRYKIQLDSYKAAAERISGLEVKECLIYSTKLKEAQVI